MHTPQDKDMDVPNTPYRWKRNDSDAKLVIGSSSHSDTFIRIGKIDNGDYKHLDYTREEAERLYDEIGTALAKPPDTSHTSPSLP